jgi:glucose-6-phosphate 1-dehydrogenase
MSPRVVAVRAERPVEQIRLPTAQECMVVIFGATGDLSRRKLVPALYHLHRHGSLHACYGILGVSRSSMSDEEFRQQMRKACRDTEEDEFDHESWSAFARRLHYMAADLEDQAAYKDLAERLEEMGAGEPGASNRLFYLAVPPDLMSDIVEGLATAGLTGQGEAWTRIVIEKPFGWNLESARQLNQQIGKHFAENQVYRIDHFLGKEMVQNLLAFRFGNILFEPVWNRNYVDYVEITAAETLGVGERAGFYEETGALRDMVANHMLQVLTLTTMEPPVAYDAASVREEKVQVLRSIRPMNAEEVRARTIRGQYGPGQIDGKRVRGYREEEGVDPHSTTETYAAVDFRIDNWRWAGVPFYLRTGKRLARTMFEVAIHFKPTPHTIFVHREGQVAPNVIVIRLKPEEGIDVTFSAKVPGEEMETARVRMEFDYDEAFGVELPEAYETLLLEAMQGDPTLFLRADEVEWQWTLIDPILEVWSAEPPSDLTNYEAGSEGPAAAHELVARNGHGWRSILEE